MQDIEVLIKSFKEDVAKVPPGKIRVFVQIYQFTPFYFDADPALQKSKLLFYAQIYFLKTQNSKMPMNLHFTRFARFRDAILIQAAVAYLLFKDPVTRPISAEPLGAEQEWSKAFALDGGDFSVYFGQRFPGSFYINQLIVAATNPAYLERGSTRGRIVQSVLLFYYHAWLTPAQLIEKLVERFDPLPLFKGGQELQQYYQLVQVPLIREEVLNLLEALAEFYRDDIGDADSATMTTFLGQLTQPPFAEQAQRITSVLNQHPPTVVYPEFTTATKCSEADCENGMQHLADPMRFRLTSSVWAMYLGGKCSPRSVFNSSAKYEGLGEFRAPQGRFDTTSYEPLAVVGAEQLAGLLNYYLYETYALIRPREFVGSPQQKAETLHKCPNVALHIRRTNQITSLIGYQILTAKKKAAVYEKWLTVAATLRDMRNYDACAAVVSGLTQSPVIRLDIFTQLSIPLYEKDAELKRLFGLGDNWYTVRKEMQNLNSDQFCVPVLSIVTKDVFVVEDSAGRFENGRANFSRALLVWRAVHSFLRFYVGEGALFKLNPQLYVELSEFKIVGEENLWQMSYEVKPK